MDDDPDSPLSYMQTAALAQVVVDAFTAGNRECCRSVFERLEQLLTSPLDQADRNLLIVGFLEDLQGCIGWARLPAEPIYELLGEKSRAHWDSLNTLWEDIGRWKLNGTRSAAPDVNDLELRKIVRSLYRPPRSG
jgi:hypothetical protein